MVEISLSGSGEGLGGENPRGYSTTWFRNHSPGSERLDWSQLGDGRGHFTPDSLRSVLLPKMPQAEANALLLRLRRLLDEHATIQKLFALL